MAKAIILAFLTVFSGLGLSGVAVYADEFRLSVYGDTEHLGQYEHALLKVILDAAPGDHNISFVRNDLPRTRLTRMLSSGGADFDIYYAGYDKKLAEELRLVRVPITRGLLGYRVFVGRQSVNDQITPDLDLNGLRSRFILGSGADWPDTVILREAGFRIVTEEAIGLWRMLSAGRFHIFPRGLYEAFREMDTYGALGVGDPFRVNAYHMIHYDFDIFYYVRKDDERRARLIEDGFASAFESGAIDKLFREHPHAAAGPWFLKNYRGRIWHLENSLLGEDYMSIPAEYWFRPDGAAGHQTGKTPD